jgi:hydrogenase nickel incorporation protein HypA/HybF
MHEIGIANSILEAVQTEVGRRPGAIPQKILVRIGELAAVDPDALRFSFEVLIRETSFERLQLEILMCPLRHHCEGCDIEFSVKEFEVRCPRCGNERTKRVSGDQLELAQLEIKDYEPSTA